MNQHGSRPAAPFGALAQLQGMDPDEMIRSAKVGLGIMREIQAKAWAEGYQVGRLAEKGSGTCNPYKGDAA
jgi:hypothetical protein